MLRPIMQRKHYSPSLMMILAIASGCSLINKFDPIAEPEGSGGAAGDGDGDGDGDGGETTESPGGSGSGGEEPMGGANSGGSSGSGGAPPVVEPGLIVVLPQIDGTETNSLFVISPQNGKVLNTVVMEDHEVHFAAFEPRRQVWFLNLDGKIVPSTFDRATNEWEFGEEGPETGGIVDPALVFALPERLVSFEDGRFIVYDTSDLEDIRDIGAFTAPEGTVWGAAAADKQVGGDIQYLAKHCAADADLECPVELTRIAIQASAIQAQTPTVVGTTDQSVNRTARGNIGYNRLTSKFAVLIPNKVGFSNQASVDLWTSTHGHDVSEEFYFDIPTGNQQVLSAMTIDPCHSVAYMMLNNQTDLFGVPLTGDGLFTMKKNVTTNGSGIVYEHFTGSILKTINSAGDRGIDTWTIEGTATQPSVSQRVVGWMRPSVRPRYIAVEEDNNIICED